MHVILWKFRDMYSLLCPWTSWSFLCAKQSLPLSSRVMSKSAVCLLLIDNGIVVSTRTVYVYFTYLSRISWLNLVWVIVENYRYVYKKFHRNLAQIILQLKDVVIIFIYNYTLKYFNHTMYLLQVSLDSYSCSC